VYSTSFLFFLLLFHSQSHSPVIMSNVSLVGMAQVATLMISIAEVLFFGHTLCSSNNPNPIWEPLWVTMVECICYAIQIASNSHRFEMADGAKINVISPMAWMLACPVRALYYFVFRIFFSRRR
jgi:hypothetical protein